MTDLDRTSLDRILPATPGSPDWDDVLDRAGARSGTRHPAALALAGRRHRRSDRRGCGLARHAGARYR